MKAGSLEARRSARRSPAGGPSTGSRVWIRSRRRWGISANSLGKPGQLAVGQHQRVAAAEDHLVDRAVGGDFPQRLGIPKCVAAVGDGPSCSIRKVPPEAEAAMDGARPSCYHQDSALVLPQQTGPAQGVGLAQRIGRVAGHGGQFRPPGARPAAAAGRPGRRGGCGPGTAAAPTAESRRPPARPRPPTRGRKPQQPAKLGRAADRLGQDRLPVGPGRRRRSRRLVRSVQLAIMANLTITRPPQKAKREEQSWPATTPANSARA